MEAKMSREMLFPELPETDRVESEWAGGPRLREPMRDQVELRAVDLDALLPAEHPARVIWRYVEKLDLTALEEAVRARAHGPGQSAASPRLLLSLWLYGTSQAIGSARALARLCESHDAYRWLCGGVSVNYHGLADFRSAHPELLDRLLAENVASLSMAGVIDLDEVAQDGVRVRAWAGASSYRRKKKLHKELKKAKRLIEHLKQENEDDHDASNRRIPPMLESIRQWYGRLPKRHLVDGGFNKNEDIEWAAAGGTKVYGPPANSKHKTDPYAPRRDDGPGVAAWRKRMKSSHGKGVYKRRARAECINARFRNWGLRQITVRGREKVRAVLQWFALANNILAGHRLLQAQT
jgi:transposase